MLKILAELIKRIYFGYTSITPSFCDLGLDSENLVTLS